MNPTLRPGSSLASWAPLSTGQLPLLPLNYLVGGGRFWPSPCGTPALCLLTINKVLSLPLFLGTREERGASSVSKRILPWIPQLGCAWDTRVWSLGHQQVPHLSAALWEPTLQCPIRAHGCGYGATAPCGTGMGACSSQSSPEVPRGWRCSQAGRGQHQAGSSSPGWHSVQEEAEWILNTESGFRSGLLKVS